MNLFLALRFLLTGLLNFNGRLLPASFGSAALLLTHVPSAPFPPPWGLLLDLSPSKPPPKSPPRCLCGSSTAPGRGCGAVVCCGTALVAPGTWVALSKLVDGDGDAASEASVFISSCSASPRGPIKEGSNFIKATQPSAGRHVSPSHFPVTSLPLPRRCGVLGCSRLLATPSRCHAAS